MRYLATLLLLASSAIAADPPPAHLFFQSSSFFQLAGINPGWEGDRIALCADPKSEKPLVIRATWSGADGSGYSFEAFVRPGKCGYREVTATEKPAGGVKMFWSEATLGPEQEFSFHQ